MGGDKRYEWNWGGGLNYATRISEQISARNSIGPGEKTSGGPDISPEGSQVLVRNRQYDAKASYLGFENESLTAVRNHGLWVLLDTLIT